MTRPTREPDYISKTGTYFWFGELAFLSLNGYIGGMLVEESSSLLRIPERYLSTWTNCGECWRCAENKDCERAYFNKEIQHAYKQWVERSFEVAFQLDEPNEKQR